MNLAFPQAITQERVSCYNLSDILVQSTVPMFFQHFDFFFFLIQMKQSELNSLAHTVTTKAQSKMTNPHLCLEA